MEHFKHAKTFRSYSYFQETFFHTTLDNTVRQSDVLYNKKLKIKRLLFKKIWLLNTLNSLDCTSLDPNAAKGVHSVSFSNPRISVTGQEGARSRLLVPKD